MQMSCTSYCLHIPSVVAYIRTLANFKTKQILLLLWLMHKNISKTHHRLFYRSTKHKKFSNKMVFLENMLFLFKSASQQEPKTDFR